MILVQDQYTQNSRKNYETELQLKQDTSKQFYSDPKECWEIESVYNEDILTSGNDSEGEGNLHYGNQCDFPEEVLENRGQTNFFKKKPFKPKNVRFGKPDFNCILNSSETSSGENEEVGDCEGCDVPIHHRREPEMVTRKDQYRVPLKAKCRTPECGHERKNTCDVRPKSEPERNVNYLESFSERRPVTVEECKDLYDPRHRTRRKEHRCGRPHESSNIDHDLMFKRLVPRPYKFEAGDDTSARHRFGDCCNHCPPEDKWVRLEKKIFKTKPNPNPSPNLNPNPNPTYKHVCHVMKEPSEYDTKTYRKAPQYENYHTGGDRYCSNDEYYEYNYGIKGKKKTLEAVQEQQEQFSDSTYKVPCNKHSNHSISGEVISYPKKRSSEKLTNNTQTDWLFCEGKSKSCHVGEKHRENYSRIHKMRSRRTRMNRLKSGWKKAFVQTVRDGTRNERVGVIVMGSKGPEFYTKNSKKTNGMIPFRKSKSFLDGPAKSFEVMTVDCKNVFLSSSEPGTRTNYAINDLISPKDESKIDEKLSKFNKNVSDIVKNPDEKFYKGFLNNEFQEIQKTADGMLKGSGEGTELEDEKKKKSPEDGGGSKNPTAQLPPYESLTPRSPQKKPDKKINEISKAMAEALNEQGRKYKESPPCVKDREQVFLELREKYPPKELSPELVEANLSLWGMKLDQGKFKKIDVNNELATGDSNKEDLKEEMKSEEKSKTGRDEFSHSGSGKSTEQVSLKQRRKKYYESTHSLRQPDQKLDNSCAGDAPNSSNSKVQLVSPNKIKKTTKIRKWTETSFEDPENLRTDPKTISAVFKDLVGNGCAISQGESENLQKIFNKVSYKELCSNDESSSSSCDVISMIKENDEEEEAKKGLSLLEENKSGKKEGKEEGENERAKRRSLKESRESGSYLEEVNSRKVSKMKNYSDEKDFESKLSKKVESKEKSKKKIILDDKMKLLREALPSLAAENEAAHLKQLKKYIDKFIDRVEASTTSEFRKKKETRLKVKETSSTDSSEVRVDARKILDFVSNPFKKISSDVTINIARKLTDALVQDKEKSKCQKNLSHTSRQRRNSPVETDEELLAFGASSSSENVEEAEPTYLKQLKKMRNEHLNNIVLEVKRLSELLRFLDRCNRLTF